MGTACLERISKGRGAPGVSSGKFLHVIFVSGTVLFSVLVILETVVGCDSNSKILTRRNEGREGESPSRPSFLRVKKCFHQMGEPYLRGNSNKFVLLLSAEQLNCSF